MGCSNQKLWCPLRETRKLNAQNRGNAQNRNEGMRRTGTRKWPEQKSGNAVNRTRKCGEQEGAKLAMHSEDFKDSCPKFRHLKDTIANISVRWKFKAKLFHNRSTCSKISDKECRRNWHACKHRPEQRIPVAGAYVLHSTKEKGWQNKGNVRKKEFRRTSNGGREKTHDQPSRILFPQENQLLQTQTNPRWFARSVQGKTILPTRTPSRLNSQQVFGLQIFGVETFAQCTRIIPPSAPILLWSLNEKKLSWPNWSPPRPSRSGLQVADSLQPPDTNRLNCHWSSDKMSFETHEKLIRKKNHKKESNVPIEFRQNMLGASSPLAFPKNGGKTLSFFLATTCLLKAAFLNARPQQRTCTLFAKSKNQEHRKLQSEVRILKSNIGLFNWEIGNAHVRNSFAHFRK